MLRLTTLFLFAISLNAATHNVATLNELSSAINTAQAGDIVLVQNGVYNRPDGALDETKDFGNNKIIIRAVGSDAEFRCSPTCFVANMRSLRFENIKFTGYLNGSAWSHIDFINTIHDDSAKIGQQNLGILVKCGPQGIRTTPTQVLNGCKDVKFDNAVFTQFETAGDMALDFVAGERISVLNSRATMLGRGLIQLKGDTQGIIIHNNIILRGGSINGSRAIQVGGQADTQFWRRPPAEGVYSASDALITNNFVHGGASCIAFVDAGDVRVANNTCLEQSNFLFRFLRENNIGSPSTNIHIEQNAFGNLVGNINTAINSGGTVNWTTISRGDNLYANITIPPWPNDSIVTLPDLTRNQVEFDAMGLVIGSNAEIGKYGRQDAAQPPVTSIGPVTWIVEIEESGTFLESDETKAFDLILEKVKLFKFTINADGVGVVRDEMGIIIGITYNGKAELMPLYVKEQ